MFQWYETEDQRNVENFEHDSHTEKSFSYDTDWFEFHIDSEQFSNELGRYYDIKECNIISS